MPDLTGAVLLVEDVQEPPYKVDRMLTHLRRAGALDGLAGVAVGQFTDCGDGWDTTVVDVLPERLGDLGVRSSAASRSATAPTSSPSPWAPRHPRHRDRHPHHHPRRPVTPSPARAAPRPPARRPRRPPPPRRRPGDQEVCGAGNRVPDRNLLITGGGRGRTGWDFQLGDRVGTREAFRFDGHCG